MGCGYGACVGCTVKVKSTAPDNTKGTVLFVSPTGESPAEPSLTIRRKICKDGPVFPADAIVW
ncbi:MAG: hypothetical protein LBL54_05720 [Clostridiales Family XIII bacterium]|nr:hypothetical protein [Clostridiales Family XIII bacterium]